MVAAKHDPWAASLGQLAGRSLEQRLGACPADDSEFWTPPDFWDADDLAHGMEDHPCVWSDGSREGYPAGGFEVAGAGVYLLAPEEAFRDAFRETVEEYGDARLERRRAFMPVPRPLQTVQRAILALQAFWPGHFGI